MRTPHPTLRLASGLVLFVACSTPPPTFEATTDETTTSESTTTLVTTDLGGTDDSPLVTTTAASSSSTGEMFEHPCNACKTGEYCRWNGSDDSCAVGGFPDPIYPVSCEPLPEGCTQKTLCTDPACAHQVCGGYECYYGDPCGLGGAMQCPWRCDPEFGECSADGTACTLVIDDGDGDWDQYQCVPVAEPAVPVGGACTLVGDGDWTWSDCEPGAVCHPIDPDTQQGFCKSLCTFAPCPDPNTLCSEWYNNDVILRLCEPTCDPLVPVCGPNNSCVPEYDEVTETSAFICVPDASGDGGALYGDCQYTNACDPGLLCADSTAAPGCDPAGSGCCIPFCDLTQPACPDGLTCTPWFDPAEAPPGDEDVGYCSE